MEVRPILFELSYAPGELDLFEPNVRQQGPLLVSGRADLLSSVEEIRVRGKLSAVIEAECERCLEPASCAIERPFDLFYRPETESEAHGEVEIDDGEAELAFYEGDGLELTDILREQILLALPMQRLCRNDCQGLCPNCGVIRNRETCSCVLKLEDERWAGLRSLGKSNTPPEIAAKQ
jgi:uncharacterized protein